MPSYAISLCDALSKGQYKKASAHLAAGLPANGDLLYRPLLSISHQNPKRALELARALVEAGANVNAANDKGWRVLHHSIWLLDAAPEYLEFLLDQGADPYLQATLAMGTTECDALSACVRYQREGALKLLLSRQVKPVQPANKGPSALSCAMRMCNTDQKIQTYLYPLLEAGGNPDEVDCFGRSLSWGADPAAARALDAWVMERKLETCLPATAVSIVKPRM